MILFIRAVKVHSSGPFALSGLSFLFIRAVRVHKRFIRAVSFRRFHSPPPPPKDAPGLMPAALKLAVKFTIQVGGSGTLQRFLFRSLCILFIGSVHCCTFAGPSHFVDGRDARLRALDFLYRKFSNVGESRTRTAAKLIIPP